MFGLLKHVRKTCAMFCTCTGPAVHYQQATKPHSGLGFGPNPNGLGFPM